VGAEEAEGAGGEKISHKEMQDAGSPQTLGGGGKRTVWQF